MNAGGATMSRPTDCYIFAVSTDFTIYLYVISWNYVNSL